MRKIYRGSRWQEKPQSREFRANEKITAPVVVVIDETGLNLGAIPVSQALSEARNRELDLVEVSPKNEPPICRIMNYGSFKYQKEKQERKQKAKQKTNEIKTVKLSARIGQHDLNLRVDQAAEFLKDGDKVKIELQLRGRENQHGDLARELINRMIAEVKGKLATEEIRGDLRVEQEIKKMGNRLSAVIAFVRY